MYLHFCLVFVEGKDISCDALEEEEGALDKDVPQHGRDQDTAEVPEYLVGEGEGRTVTEGREGEKERERERELKIIMGNWKDI